MRSGVAKTLGRRNFRLLEAPASDLIELLIETLNENT